MDHPRADLMLRLGLLSLVVPILGPFVWLTASRALGEQSPGASGRGRSSRLLWGRRLGIIATVVLVGILAIALLGGQSVEGHQPG